MDATVDEAQRAAKHYWEWRDSTWLTGEPLRVPKDINSLLWKAVKDIKCAPDPFCRPSTRLNAFRDLMAPAAWHAACYLILNDLASRNIKASFESDEAFETNESKASDEVSFPFGRRLIYRGQSRPWHLMPTAWRSKPAPEFAHLWKILAGYLTKVAIVDAERHTYLDPVMINRLAGSNPRILLALEQDLPGILKQPGGPPEWEWISKAIPQSLVRFSEYAKRRGTLH